MKWFDRLFRKPPRELSDLRDSWEYLASRDPLWAILSRPEKKGGKWKEEEFFELGRREAATTIEYLERLNVLKVRARALDFGCGVGRMTQGLCQYFREVVGVDIAKTMIALADRYNACPDRCSYVVNTREDLPFENDTFDFVYTALVLQHIPPPSGRKYIAEFLRVLRPGGIALFQAPSELRKEHASPGPPEASAVPSPAPEPPTSPDPDDHLEKHILMYAIPRGEVEAVCTQAHGTLLDIAPDDWAGVEWVGYRYCVRKDPPAG
ncbi:MAG TPA: class I SAM-dependent methyltransferase [Planctomycetota bacterium]|nr:class I SAM-dependent methyltransferase [Planctomycetota bacterium]